MNPEYLGDGVYIKQGSTKLAVVLTTSNGIENTNTIYLEPEVLFALLDYINRLGKYYGQTLSTSNT